jgi:hypothetical protein
MAFSSQLIAGIDANRTIKDELVAAMARRSARRRISVTDLINPRQSFFSRTYPDIEIPPDRREVMMAGSGFHELFGRAFSTEEYIEQFVEFEEIVGKIDVFEDAPIELKTSTSLPDAPMATRPGQVEQLAMYCVMTHHGLGHLLYFQRAVFGRKPQLRAFKLEIIDPDPIKAEMRRRRDLFRRALDTGDSTGLERCEWFNRNCLYSQVCGCEAVALLPRMVTGAAVRVSENSELTRQVEVRIQAIPEAPVPRRFVLNDLVFPRKAVLRVALPADDADVEERLGSMERRGFLEQLENAIWYGAPAACKRVKLTFESLRPSVLMFRDVPTLIRSTPRREMIPRDRLHADAPYYVDRLAFECAVAGQRKGRLIIYYSAQADDKFMVYDFWFRDLDSIRAEMGRRLRLLEAGAPAADLPRCEPDWMAKLCNLAERCGCREAS